MGRIINFIVSNPILLIIIIGGLFNFAVRMQQKAKEQRAKRAALTEIQRRKDESLRTGKQSTEPIIVYDEPQKKTTKSSNAEDRQARIEALRQQRMAQLRAMREKRSGTAQSPTPQAPPRPQQRPAPRPQPKSTPPRPTQQRVVPRTTTTQRTQERPRVVAPVPRPTPMPQSTPGLETPAPIQEIVPGKNPIANAYTQSPSSRSGLGGINARSILRDPNRLREAIVASEILDAPISLRDPENAPGGVPN